MVPEQFQDHISLSLAQETVVNKYTDQLVPDCLMDKYRCNSRIDTTREPTQYLLVSDFPSNLLDCSTYEETHIPVLVCLADPKHKVLQELVAFCGMYYLRMELNSIEVLLIILNNSKGTVRGTACLDKAIRKRSNRITVTHPEPRVCTDALE